MPNPKRRHSKSRRGRRRAHDALALPPLTTCPQCREPMAMHQACPKCGYYKGREVLPVKE
jgi:large subunit ribosomal protein L32